MTDTTRLTLIQQNDTHAQMEPHWEHFWRNGRPEYRRAGGYARAATLVAGSRRRPMALPFWSIAATPSTGQVQRNGPRARLSCLPCMPWAWSS